MDRNIFHRFHKIAFLSSIWDGRKAESMFYPNTVYLPTIFLSLLVLFYLFASYRQIFYHRFSRRLEFVYWIWKALWRCSRDKFVCTLACDTFERDENLLQTYVKTFSQWNSNYDVVGWVRWRDFTSFHFFSHPRGMLRNP